MAPLVRKKIETQTNNTKTKSKIETQTDITKTKYEKFKHRLITKISTTY